MEWDVQSDEEFDAWLFGLEARVRAEIASHINLLRQFGPHLGRPHVDTVEGSAYHNMKELRVRFRGDPWRVLFAFDPTRRAILLVGGNKGGDRRWYRTNIPIADERSRRHLERLEQ